MKANTAKLLQFLKNAGILELPVYQRSYSWEIQQCEQLWQDITSLIRNTDIPTHFFGSIVYAEKEKSQIGTINTYQLIDGQQRLTTVSLLLAAMNNFLPENLDSMTSDFIFNKEFGAIEGLKLELSCKDNDTYKALVLNKPELPRTYSTKLVENYEYFKNCLISSGFSLGDILTALSKFIVIDVALAQETDNPQLIFDSLNSTGMPLSQYNQIKNLLLLGLNSDEQENIYRYYLRPIEDNVNDIERFIGDYLIIQNNGLISPINRLYSAFNGFFTDRLKLQTRKEIIEHLYTFSQHFNKLITADFDEIKIREHIQKLNTLEINSAYPFLMEIVDDLENGYINTEIFVDILKMVEKQVTKQTDLFDEIENKTFSTLSKDVNKMLMLKAFTPKIINKSEEKANIA